MSKCLVTGGAGFIGSNLVDRLIELGHEVVIIDNLISGKKEYINEKASFFEIGILDESVEKIFIEEKFDYVFHLAAQIDVRKSVSDPIFDNNVNVLGSLNLLKNCHLNNVKKIIFASTGGAIYGDAKIIPTSEEHPELPVSPYGIHKLCFEKYLNYYKQVFNQDYIALRFANVYGPRQFKGGEAGIISILTDNAVKGEKTTIFGTGKQTRDFVYVDDVVDSLIFAMKSKESGVSNISTGIETNLLQIIDALEKALGYEILREHAPARIGEQLRSSLDNTKAKNVLGWVPKISLEEGIRKTIEWSKNTNK